MREDNAVLSEAKSKLEDQLATANKRIDSIMDELVSYQIQCEESQSVGITLAPSLIPSVTRKIE